MSVYRLSIGEHLDQHWALLGTLFTAPRSHYVRTHTVPVVNNLRIEPGIPPSQLRHLFTSWQDVAMFYIKSLCLGNGLAVRDACIVTVCLG